MPEVIPIGADHAGFELKRHHEARRGGLLCGTGLGLSYAAEFAGGRHQRRVANIEREHG
jgi:ribose 5-phosphate isomerase RpiB